LFLGSIQSSVFYTRRIPYYSSNVFHDHCAVRINRDLHSNIHLCILQRYLHPGVFYSFLAFFSFFSFFSFFACDRAKDEITSNDGIENLWPNTKKEKDYQVIDLECKSGDDVSVYLISLLSPFRSMYMSSPSSLRSRLHQQPPHLAPACLLSFPSFRSFSRSWARLRQRCKQALQLHELPSHRTWPP